MANAGNAAATTLQSLTTATPSADSSRHFDNLLHLMRLAHIRQRFTSDPPLPAHHPDYAELLAFLKQSRPDRHISWTLDDWAEACKARYPNHHDPQ